MIDRKVLEFEAKGGCAKAECNKDCPYEDDDCCEEAERMPKYKDVAAFALALMDERDALAAENKRLREALEQIANHPEPSPFGAPQFYDKGQIIARAALEGK